MSNTVISVENLSKYYRLGTIGSSTLRDDVDRLWARVRGKPDPLSKIGHSSLDVRHSSNGHSQETNDKGQTTNKTQPSALVPQPSDSIWALRDVSFEVKQGQVVGIIGRNGAGKSTLLKILSRITAPTSGVVKVKGRIASLLEVGTGFHPELTGRENIFLNGAILGMKRAEIQKKFDEIVAFAEVEKFIDTPVKRYSSGMYVRLAFAVAAHLEPEILLVDEVLAVGDAAFQKKCLGKMGDVAREGRTVLFVSHNMGAIQNLCERGLWLDFGLLKESAASNEVIYKYLSLANKGSELSLAQRLDRVGSGRIRFSSLSVRDNHANRISSVATGQELSFEITYNSDSKETIRNVMCALVVRDVYGNRLLTLSSHLSGGNFVGLAPSGILLCKVPSIPLAPGLYQLDLWSSVNGEPTDCVENVVELSITEGDFYGTGKLPESRKHGPFVVPHSWESGDANG